MALRTPNTAPSKPTQVAEPEVKNDNDPYLTEEQADAALDDVPQGSIKEEVADKPLKQASVSRAVSTHVEEDVGNDDSFDDLDQDLGFGSFPMVKLDKDVFVTSDGDEFDHLDVILKRMSRKTLIKARAGQDDDIPFVYTYNNETALDGRSVADHLREWREDGDMPAGADPIKAEYLEVLAEVCGSGNEAYDGEMVILNIAPASKRRLAGYKLKLQAKGLAMHKVVTRVIAGAKITKGNKSFHPWDFKLVGKLGE
jgi:hypothetical protein